MTNTAHHPLPDGRQIACRLCPGAGPTIVFLPGYMSDMAGSKATAVFDWAAARGQACLLFDYSGCGQSPGDFADGTLTRWRDEALALIAAHAPGPVILVGSSMGGWLMLLIALEMQRGAIPAQIAALVGIAAAPDFTQWGYTPEQQATLATGQTILEPNPYGPEPTPTHARFWADGQAHRLLPAPIPITAPVRLLQGEADTDVPPAIAHRLSAALRSDDVQLTLVKGGDHRLSRTGDIALLLRTLASLLD